jgi:hypothetical protein
MTNTIFNATFNALEGLFFACRELQAQDVLEHCRRRARDGEDKDVLAFLSEWMTIRVGCGRRTGKTVAVKKLLDAYELNAIVVLPNLDMGRIYKDIDVTAISPRTLHRVPTTQPLDCVVVDEAEYCDLAKVAKFCLPYVRTYLNDQSKPFVLVLISTAKLELPG